LQRVCRHSFNPASKGSEQNAPMRLTSGGVEKGNTFSRGIKQHL
jgi:hypothetical protein